MLNQKPFFSLPQIFNMNLGFLGIQFAWGLQMANMSSLYQLLGANESQLPYLWLAAPVTGLLIQPVVGYFSDHTWFCRGRRRPYFMMGALLSALALILMPHASTVFMAALFLWILDASINITMEPFRAFVGDMLPNTQRKVGFAFQSFLIGIGAALASALPFLLNKYSGNQAMRFVGKVPFVVEVSFYVGAAVLLATVFWTVMTTPEYPSSQMAAFEKEEFRTEPFSFFSGLVNGFKKMPSAMKKLGLIQFFTWMGLFCMWIYFSPAIAHHIFGAIKGHADYADLIAQAGQWAGVCFAVYNGICILFSFLLLRIANKFSARSIHAIALFIGGISLISIAIIHDKEWLLLSMVGIGIAWASILSMPYAMLANILPAHKMGFYMGVFNFFIALPQIVSSLGLSGLCKLFPKIEALFILEMGGALMIVASLLTLKICFREEPLLAPQQS